MSEEERANISALQVELAESQAELTEQCRLNGMGQEREARLMAQLQEAERKLAELMKLNPSSRIRTVDKLPEEVLLAKQIMKLIGKRNPKIVLKAIMIVLKTTEVVELIEGGKNSG